MKNSPENGRVSKVLQVTSSAIQRLSDIDDKVWSLALELLKARAGKIVVTGIGKSGYIAMKMAATLTSLGQQATFLHPVEAFHGDSGTLHADDVIIAFSFSGATKEVVRFVQYAREQNDNEIIGVTQSTDTPLGELSSVVIPVVIEEEGCPLNLAPMASTTAMLAIGDALAAGLTSPDLFTKHDFARFHPGGSLGLSLTPVHTKMLESDEIRIGSTIPLQDVLLRMTEVGKGVLAVVNEDGVLEGSVTDGDIRRFFSKDMHPKDPCAGDAMTKDPKFVPSTGTLKDALELMEFHKITNVFVVDEERKPVGILHIHDIVGT